jgi:PPM family protein phosphatase
MIARYLFFVDLSILENAMAIEDDRKTIVPIEHKSDEVHVVAMSHVGCVREENQDYMGRTSKNGWELLIVCDGMGGHSGGFEASRIAVRSMISFFEQNCGIHDPKEFIQQTILHANTKVFKTAQDNVSLKGMGTTVTLLLKRGDLAWYGHVGDSRIYFVRNEEVVLLTIDHSVVNRWVMRGDLHPDDTNNHRYSHILERSVGIDLQMRVGVCDVPIRLKEGDRFMLCSDGFSGLANDDDIKSFFQKTDQFDLKMAVELGINHALANGADDNTTIGTLEVLDAHPVTSDDVRDSLSNINIDTTGSSVEESEDDFDFAAEDTLNLPLNDVQAILSEIDESSDNTQENTQDPKTTETQDSTKEQDIDETELDDTVIDTSHTTSIDVDVDLSQFNSSLYEYFVPEDARAKLLTMYMANTQDEKKNL